MTAPLPARSDDHSVSEDAMGDVSAVLLNLEHTISRAKKGPLRIRTTGGGTNAELALEVVIAELTKQHKRLMQDTYYAGDSVRLL